MPELIEVEYYRRLADSTVGREIRDVSVLDPMGARGGLDKRSAAAALSGATVRGTRRIGKLLLVDTDASTIGIRFGMTGRLLVDGASPIERLEYSSGRDDPAWDRLIIDFTGGGDLRNRDPRRLGGVELDPDESRLGVEASTVSVRSLRTALGSSTASLKGRLLDQSRLAGLGNLLVDESLWRCGLSPTREARSLDHGDTRLLASTIRSTVRDLSARGGSHRGDLHDSRAPGEQCPRDGAPLQRAQIAGRTTYWCPAHQS